MITAQKISNRSEVSVRESERNLNKIFKGKQKPYVMFLVKTILLVVQQTRYCRHGNELPGIQCCLITLTLVIYLCN